MLLNASLFKLFSNQKKETEIFTREYFDDGLLTTNNKSIQTDISKIAITFKKLE